MDPKNLFVNFTSISSYTLFQAIILYDLKGNQQTNREKMAKTEFWPVLPKFGTPKFLSWVLPLLDLRHCRKLSLHSISRKTYDSNPRKWQKTSFWTWFRPAGPKFGPQIFFCKTNSTVPSYHPRQFKGKLVNQTWENFEKPNFGPSFCQFQSIWPTFGPPNLFFEGFTSIRC